MSAVWMRARAELRQQWKTWLALAIILGITGGIAMATAAGARRTASVFDRLVESTKAHDLIMQQNDEDIDPAVVSQVLHLPQVESYGRVAMVPADLQQPGEPFNWSMSLGAPADTTIGTTLDRFRILAGRRMDFSKADEVMVNADFIRTRGFHVGDTLQIRTVTFDELFAAFEGNFPIPTGPRVTLRIVGVAQLPEDVGFREENRGLVYLTPAFLDRYGDRIATLGVVFVKLRHGAEDLQAYTSAVRKIAGEDQAFGFETRVELEKQVHSSLNVQATALWGFTGILALGALLLIGQAIGRALHAAADEDDTMRALGAGRGTRAAALLIPVVFASVGGAVVAVIVGVIGTRWMPIGSARALEPTGGIRVDPLVLGVGAAAIIVGILGRAAISAGGIARARTNLRRRPSIVPESLARAGATPPLVNGARFALEPGRGRSAIPVRSVMAGVAAGILAMCAVATFDASFQHLLDDPKSYGWMWDVVLPGGEDAQIVEQNIAKIAESPLVAGVSAVRVQTIGFKAHDLDTVSIEPKKGSVTLRVVEGRLPAGPDEVALGAHTLRDTGRGIGDTVQFPGGAERCAGTEGCPLTFKVTGRVLFWSEESAPGDGAVFTSAGQASLAHSDGFVSAVVKFAPGVTYEEFSKKFKQAEGSILRARSPVDVQNLGRARGVSRALAIVLAMLAISTIALALVTSVRRRARDLGVLKVLGFVKGQVRRTVAWQATILIAIALAIGVPMGAIIGRWAWRLMADSLAVVDAPRIPLGLVVAGAIALIIVANLIAAFPARAAARTKPGVVLRAE
jgi:hypothetical protein